jgi:desulfoferrodoxin-like iron-binding protein
MAEKNKVFKCLECKRIVAVLQEPIVEGKGDLHCCGQKMIDVTPSEAKRFTFGVARPGSP